MKVGTCKNCNREITCSPTTGLCSFCERTRNEGMAKGASEENALSVARDIAPNIRTGSRTAHLLPWNKEGWDMEHIEGKQEVKEEISTNPLNVGLIDEISDFFPPPNWGQVGDGSVFPGTTKITLTINLTEEPEIAAWLAIKAKQHRRSLLQDEVLSILDAQLAADREAA